MSWVKLDDGFFDHPKTIAVGAYGVALFLASCCWSSANLTDGRIPAHVVPLLRAKTGTRNTTVKALLAQKMWLETGDGDYQINGYLERNPSRAHVEKERARWREYKRSSTGASAKDSTAESTSDSTADSAPSRPDPTRSDLQLPPTPTVTRLTGRAGGVLKELLKAERATSGPVTNRKAWEAAVATRLVADYGPRIDTLVARYTDAPPDVIASYLRGEGNTLSYYREQDAG